MRLGPGWATGIGSLPGTDIREAVRIVAGELPELPHLPELPARGPGADMIGRGAAVLVGLAVETTVTGWRLAGAPGREARRAASHLSEDLDALEEAFSDAELPVKLAVAGPWTLAAAIELTHGDKALADAGACRDLAASLSQGVSDLVAEVRKRLPRAQLLLQVDEPSVPGVLLGSVPTASGFGRLGAVEEPIVVAALRAVIEAAGDVPVVVHCCASEPPLDLFVRAGAAALSWDLTLRRSEAARRSLEEQVATAVEGGVGVLAGLVPTGPPLSDVGATLAPVQAIWRRTGLAAESLREVVVTPTCGLAGASPQHARDALALARRSGLALADDPEAAR